MLNTARNYKYNKKFRSILRFFFHGSGLLNFQPSKGCHPNRHGTLIASFLLSFHVRYVTECIRRLCGFSLHNAVLCSTSGVFSKVVNMLLESDTQNIDYNWAGMDNACFLYVCLRLRLQREHQKSNRLNTGLRCFLLSAESLIGILEAIGSHSVTSSELKQMIGLFAPLENGAQVNDSNVSILVQLRAVSSQASNRISCLLWFCFNMLCNWLKNSRHFLSQ